MNYFGSINLADGSRAGSSTGQVGFIYDIGPADSDVASVVNIIDSVLMPGDTTYFQNQVIGKGGIPLVLRDWTYFGGHAQDATTFVDGTWMYRWYDPEYLKYSVWYRDYNSSQYTQVGYKLRDPIEQHVGSFYAPMVVPKMPGHYQVRWVYYKANDTYAHEVINSFTSMSRGIDPMRDYPVHPSTHDYLINSSTNSTVTPPTVVTLPALQVKNIGENAVFTLQFNGVVSPLTYQWRKGGVNLTDGVKYSGTTTNTLTINDIALSDGDFYTCVIGNTVESTVAWMVIDPP